MSTSTVKRIKSAPPSIPGGDLPNLLVLNFSASARSFAAIGAGLVHTHDAPCVIRVDQSVAMPEMGADSLPLGPCRIVVFYENIEAKERADKLNESIRGFLGHNMAFENSLWKLSILRERSIQSLAMDDALNADIILFGLETGADVDQKLDEFNQLWSAQRSKDGLLAVQLNDAVDGKNKWLRSYFQRVAEHAGLDYLFGAADEDSLPESPELAAGLRLGLGH